jgi:hypothetical protein
MGRTDYYHEHVRKALENDGWTVTHDRMPIPFDDTFAEIDFGAERVIIATKQLETIAVEVKNFLHPKKKMSELEKSIGQYVAYRTSLKVNDSNRKLYLAITEEAYQRIFTKPLMASIVRDINICFIIFNPYTYKITLWKE